MANGFPPGPWDQESDQFVVEDRTMCRIPSLRPGPLSWIQEPIISVAPLVKKALELTINVIGSPFRDQKYQYQFVSPADCRPKNSSTIWLVEKTGYEIYGVSLDYITGLAPAGGYGWITPQATLVGWLNRFQDGSIKTLVVFSHGLRGLIALRYGWEDAKVLNYGLSVGDVASIDAKKFATEPTVEFDSCNSGVPESSGGLSVAQALANHIHAAVGGWTGRTSYADVNSGAACAVQESGQTRNPFSSETWKEIWSRHKAGGTPEYKLFQPASK